MEGISDSRMAIADRAYHDTIAREYDRVVVRPREQANRRLFGRLLAGVSGDRALDLGCGTGHLALRIAPRFRSVVGVDHSEAMLATARANAAGAGLANIEFRQADIAEAMATLPSSGFDLIGAVGFLHHLAPQALQPLLAACRRCLAPGGRIAIAEPLECEEPAPIRDWNQRVFATLPAYSDPAPDPDEAPLDEAALRAAIAGAGLRIAREVRAWDVLTHDYPPRLLERWRAARLLSSHPGGNVIAMLLEAAP